MKKALKITGLAAIGVTFICEVVLLLLGDDEKVTPKVTKEVIDGVEITHF